MLLYITLIRILQCSLIEDYIDQLLDERIYSGEISDIELQLGTLSTELLRFDNDPAKISELTDQINAHFAVKPLSQYFFSAEGQGRSIKPALDFETAIYFLALPLLRIQLHYSSQPRLTVATKQLLERAAEARDYCSNSYAVTASYGEDLRLLKERLEVVAELCSEYSLALGGLDNATSDVFSKSETLGQPWEGNFEIRELRRIAENRKPITQRYLAAVNKLEDSWVHNYLVLVTEREIVLYNLIMCESAIREFTKSIREIQLDSAGRHELQRVSGKIVREIDFLDKRITTFSANAELQEDFWLIDRAMTLNAVLLQCLQIIEDESTQMRPLLLSLFAMTVNAHKLRSQLGDDASYAVDLPQAVGDFIKKRFPPK